MADLVRKRNEELARILHQLSWSPERLAREVNLVLPAGLSISLTAPYKWRDRGMVPRAPHDLTVCEVLSRAVGIAVTYEQLWGRMGSNRGAKVLSARLLTDPWTADTAQLALREAGAQAAPVRLTDLFRGGELAAAVEHWSSPPPPLTGGEGALRVTGGQLTDLRLGYHGKRRLAQACGGGLVLEPARAELAMAGKLLELGGYADDERLGRALYGAAGRLARLVGWAAADLGQEAAAQRSYVAALRAAHAAGRPRLAMSVVGSLAVQVTYQGAGRGLDPAALLGRALAAVGDRLSQRQRARQLGRLALARARSGQRAGAEAAAEEAFALLGAEGGWRRAELLGLVGGAYLFLDEHEQARPMLTEAVAGAAGARSRALLLIRLAGSWQRTGEAVRAAEAADQARRLAAGMQSQVVARALRELDGRPGQGAAPAVPGRWAEFGQEGLG
ncbi:hypothetical protein OG500_26085 [Kitasatospora sp. NBC_01250]|uniref:hypothetical protein n=1 Tax=unclassified Kitasatospora TaxID=2633591 RepID=UPI002E0E03C5|nr:MULTISPECIES: hypothetical protein [unclassified Kitasatospora]WSJ69559.1 hypothetical protein OG294_27635 [Kitasatospora sp. NBC_01302]